MAAFSDFEKFQGLLEKTHLSSKKTQILNVLRNLTFPVAAFYVEFATIW